MKKTATIILLLVSILSAHAQDIITKTNGDDIKAKVLEVTQTDIKYKRFESPDGPAYTISKADVLMIRYQDGTKDIFTTETNTKKKDDEIIYKKKEKPVKTKQKKPMPANTPTGYIVIGGGFSFPIGAFSSTDGTNPSSGYAMTGGGGFIECAMPIKHSHFGIAFNAAFNVNNINMGEYNSNWNLNNPGYNSFWQTDVSYSTISLMAGGYFTYPVKKFSFDLKLLAGLAVCTFPSVAVYVEDLTTHPATSANENVNSDTEYTFAYGGNISVRYAIVKHFCVLAQVGLISANPTYSLTLSGSNTQTITSQQPTTIVNLSAGFGYQF